MPRSRPNVQRRVDVIVTAGIPDRQRLPRVQTPAPMNSPTPYSICCVGNLPVFVFATTPAIWSPFVGALRPSAQRYSIAMSSI